MRIFVYEESGARHVLLHGGRHALGMNMREWMMMESAFYGGDVSTPIRNDLYVKFLQQY